MNKSTLIFSRNEPRLKVDHLVENSSVLKFPSDIARQIAAEINPRSQFWLPNALSSVETVAAGVRVAANGEVRSLSLTVMDSQCRFVFGVWAKRPVWGGGFF